MSTPSTDASQPIQHIGYIGLGIMGSAMAANLLKARFRLTVWNRTAARCEPLVRLGATAAASPADVARSGAQVVCVNVTDTPDVEQVLLGPGGVMEGAAPGLIVIDHSTISPTATVALAEKLDARGVTLLDAPVSGGDVGARNGTLSIMVGGDAAAFGRCLPLLESVGRAVTHVGGPGAGQACKACNQVAVVCNLLGVSESMALAIQLGLDPRQVVEVVAAGAGGSWQMSNLAGKILDGDDRPGFRVDLVLKDLAIVAEAARQSGAPVSGMEVARRYFEQVAERGGAASGTQAIAHALEELGGFSYRRAARR